jgi:hypothetical protein
MARGREEAGAIVILLVLSQLASTSGCATGSAVVTGEARLPIDPSQVKLYLDPPPEYETIGLVESSSDVEFSSQAAMDRATNELKEQAAKIGANGVVLLGTASQSSLTAGAREEKVARGKAIWVADPNDRRERIDLEEQQRRLREAIRRLEEADAPSEPAPGREDDPKDRRSGPPHQH